MADHLEDPVPGLPDVLAPAASHVAQHARQHSCRLLGGTFAMFVQAALAAAAIATLIYKRSTEKPRRPWVVWFFDASKQAFAGMLQHAVNLAFGILFAAESRASECAWYITNFSISVACGVLILWAMMAGYKWCVDRYHLTLLRSGEYGSPPSWKPWLAQLLIWGFFSSFEKFLTAIFVIYPLHKHLDGMAAWLEKPLVAFPAVELVFVMVLAPVVLNMAFFWVVDNLIMRKRRTGQADGVDDKVTEPLLEDDQGGTSPPFSPTRCSAGPEYQAPPLSSTATRRQGVNGGQGGAPCGGSAVMEGLH